MIRTLRPAAATALVAALLAPAAARANPGDTYGWLSHGLATAGAQTATAEDAAASYYNPAGLALGGKDAKSSVQLGYQTGLPFASLHHDSTDYSIQAAIPEWKGWITFAGKIPLRGRIGKRAALGFALYHPQDKLVRVQTLDPKTPQWLRYQSMMDRVALTAGLGVRLGDWAALGLGANVLASLEGKIDFDVDLFAKRVKQRDMTFDLVTNISPIAGLSVTPPELPLRFGLAWRGPIRLGVVQPSVIGLGDVGSLLLDVKATVHYTPHQLSAGVRWDAHERVRLAADVLYAMWHLAPNPAAEVAVGLNGEVPEGLGLDQALALATKDASPGFQDTVAPALGVEVTLPDKVTVLRGGLSWRPTFVPDQVRETNFLDNSAFVAAAGATFRFKDPTEIFAGPLFLDLGAQLQVFKVRSVEKLQAADPVGNYRFGGTALALAATLRYELTDD